MAKEEMYTSDEYDEVLRMAIEALKEQKTGKWIKYIEEKFDITELWNCSECGYQVREQTRFCPYCGVRMIGDEDEID